MSRRRLFAKRALTTIAIGGIVLCALQFYRAPSASSLDGHRTPSRLLHRQAVDEREMFAGHVVDRYDAVDEAYVAARVLNRSASAFTEIGRRPGDVDELSDRHQSVIDRLRQWRYSGRSAKLSDSAIDRRIALQQQQLANAVIKAAGIDVDALEVAQLDEEDERDRAVELRYGKAAGAAARKSRFPSASSTAPKNGLSETVTVAADVKPVLMNEKTPGSPASVPSVFFNDSFSIVKNRSAEFLEVLPLRSTLSSSIVEQSFRSPPPQQSRYIPHRCPRDMDINDTEYDWFRTAVVQRSPASHPPPASTSYSAAAAAAANAYSALEDEILILTPITNAERHARRFFQNICSLVYPHRLISIVLGEDSSSDKTPEVVQDLVEQVQPYFRRVELVRLPSGPGARVSSSRRHDPSWQFIRRRHLATVRNRLLMQGLGVAGPSVRWVLWIDSDVRHIPRDLIRHLLSANQSVVVPNCLWKKDNGQTDQFDRNTWQETDLSRAELRAMKPDELKLEGYSESHRRYLTDLKTDGDLVRVDGVGGCVLLVSADLHRSGLVFPPFVFDHHIETEGFARAVALYGVSMFGLPSVNVIHW